MSYNRCNIRNIRIIDPVHCQTDISCFFCLGCIFLDCSIQIIHAIYDLCINGNLTFTCLCQCIRLCKKLISIYCACLCLSGSFCAFFVIHGLLYGTAAKWKADRTIPYKEAYDTGYDYQNCKNHDNSDQCRARLLIRLGLGWLRLLVGRRSRLWLCWRWFYRCCCLWLRCWCRLNRRCCLWLRCWCWLNRRCCLWLRCLSWLYWRWCWLGRFYCWLYRRWLCYRCTALSTESCTRFNGRTTFYTYLILLRLWLYGLLWSCRLHFSQLFCKITSAFGTKLGIILNFTLTLWTLHLILSSSFYSNICVPYPIPLHVFYAE